MPRAWPSTLPRGNGEDSSLTPMGQTRRTRMEAGPARNRRLTRQRRDMLSIRWRFNATEMAIFRAWFRDAVSGPAMGSEWFSMEVSIGGGFLARDVRFAPPPGEPPFQAQLLRGDNWDVSATLEVAEDG